MRAVSLSLRVLKIDDDLRSGNGVTKWTSELTIVRFGMMLNLRPVSCSFGNMRRASRNVETTLTVTVILLVHVRLRANLIVLTRRFIAFQRLEAPC